jgi:hypothetical protein
MVRRSQSGSDLQGKTLASSGFFAIVLILFLKEKRLNFRA